MSEFEGAHTAGVCALMFVQSSKERGKVMGEYVSLHARSDLDEPTQALATALQRRGVVYPVKYHGPKRRYRWLRALAAVAIVAGLVAAIAVLMWRSKHQPVPVKRDDTTPVYCLPAANGWWHCSRSPIDSIPPVPSNGPVV